MSSHDDAKDDIYQVPRSSLEINSSCQALIDAKKNEETPPVLMPKKGNSVLRSSFILDRQGSINTPSPPPRQINRNTSLKAFCHPQEGRAESLPDLNSTTQKTSGETNSFSGIPAHQVEFAVLNLSELLPEKDVNTTVKSISDSNLSTTSDQNKVFAATLASTSISMNIPPIPKPVPKPRTVVPQVASQRPTFHSNSLTHNASAPASFNYLQKETCPTKSQESVDLPSDVPRKSSVPFCLPPDADSIESMLNEEIDKKYGLLEDRNNSAELSSREIKSHVFLSNTSANHDELLQDTTPIPEIDEYMCSKNNFTSADHSVHRSTAPKPHAPKSLPSYLSMKDPSSHSSAIAAPAPHTPASPPSYFPMIDQQKGYGLLDTSSYVPSSPLKPGANIHLGLDLLSESSSDSLDLPEPLEEKTKTVPPATNTTIPKPFSDIKPFVSQTSIISESTENTNNTRSGSSNQVLDFSDFDPLFMDKSKSPLHFPDTLNNFSNGGANKSSSNASFVVDWLSAFNEVPKSPPSSSALYATAEDVDEYPAVYYSQISAEAKEMISPKPSESQINRKSFHHDAPTAPPPPLPRIQNRPVQPKPPPIPPRPDNVPIVGASPSLPTVPVPVPTSNASIRPVAPSLPFSNSHQAKNITDPFNVPTLGTLQPSLSQLPPAFPDLPTPVFTPAQSNDPFLGSNFDYECLKFNTAQTETPALPERIPLAQNLDVSYNATSPASDDSRQDPGRISRFVIPPPGTVITNKHSEEYDLARELSSSDSECSDISGLDISPQSWTSTSVPVGGSKLTDRQISVRKTSRDGYLYKQGGYKANKGWKKRWVVFNGSSLSYYSNNTSQVSKRIIPVRCMVTVEQAIKSTDKNSFKFKVVTTLKDRVFIFSSETLDDCLTWANVLMAAITEYQKSFINGEEMPPEKPDKEGFIKFSNMKRYYVTLTGSILLNYQSFEDYQMGSPSHEINMKLCSVKIKDNRKLELWIHYGRFDMTFESEQEMQQWRMAMEDAIAEGLADDTVLAKVYENQSNQQCADCGAENPHWASINLGIVLCKNCAGVHRMFDYRLSKIRSLRMDTRVWTPSLVEIMVTIGNANSNTFWEFMLPPGTKIQPKDSMDKRKEYINMKYKAKKFCNIHPLFNCKQALGETFLETARTDDVLEMLRILFSGVDVLFQKEENGQRAFDIAKENGQRLIMELLIQNGGDVQNLDQDLIDENRLREDIRLQGYLNKTGPTGKTFEKRWCILEHGALTYYINEKSKTSKGSIDRKEMCMIQGVDTDRTYYSFEVSTSSKETRVYTFSSDSKDEYMEWFRALAKLMAPVCAMDHIAMSNMKLAGPAHIKESLSDEWHQTFLIFVGREIHYVTRDLRLDFIDLRKASSIIYVELQDPGSGYQQRGQCFVISCTGRSVYLQAKLARDTERMFLAFLEASTISGPSLTDQALTNENVPVIVERCITHIHLNGLEEKGIYRTAGQNSRVQALLDDFRRDAWSVSLADFTVQDVANVLKRFLRELQDSLFEKINYNYWINMAGCQDKINRLKWYKYYLDKMPQVNYQTLKRIILHLVRVAESEKVNLMSVKNLASCFAPSLLRTAKDEQPDLTSDAASKEINIIIDLMSNCDYFFSVNASEREIRDKIHQAEKEIQSLNLEKKKSTGDVTATGMLIPVHLGNREGESVNIKMTETKTARQAVQSLKEIKIAPDLGVCVLYEQLFKGALERPLFPQDLVAAAVQQWTQWESWVLEDNSVCLSVHGPDLLERLQAHYSASHTLLSKLQYCDCKPKSKFKKRTVGFRQCKLALYNDSQGNSESVSWNVEDITLYLGTAHKKPPPPTRFCLTFTVNGEKYSKPVFGHCLSFETEDEMWRWAASMYTAQQPLGLLSWVSN